MTKNFKYLTSRQLIAIENLEARITAVAEEINGHYSFLSGIPLLFFFELLLYSEFNYFQYLFEYAQKTCPVDSIFLSNFFLRVMNKASIQSQAYVRMREEGFFEVGQTKATESQGAYFYHYQEEIISNLLTERQARHFAMCHNHIARVFSILPAAAAIFLFKKYCITPILRMPFPHGVFNQPPPQVVKKIRYLTTAEALEHINLLERYCQEKKTTANRYFSGMLFFYIGYVCFLLYFINANSYLVNGVSEVAKNFPYGTPPSGFWAKAFMSLAAISTETILVNGIIAVNAGLILLERSVQLGFWHYKKFMLARTLKHNENILLRIFNALGSTEKQEASDAEENCLELIAAEELSNSYFILNCTQFTRALNLKNHSAQLKNNSLAKLIENMLAGTQLSVRGRSGEKIFLDVAFQITKKEMQTLIERINVAFNRLLQRPLLKNQIAALFDMMGANFFYSTVLSEENLPANQWEVVLDRDYEELIPFLAQQLTVYSTRRDNKIYLVIHGVTPLTEGFLTRVYEKINQRKPEQASAHVAQDVTDSKRPSKLHKKKAPQSSLFQAQAPANQVAIAPVKIILWRSATYDSTNDQPLLKPLNNAHVPPLRQFLLWRLRVEDFPEPQQENYNHFFTIFNVACVVAAKGEQGAKYTATRARDAWTGFWFNASLKLKSKSNAIRVYADAEVAPETGETLYVCRAVTVKHL